MASTIDKDNAPEAEKNDIVVGQDNSPALSHRTSIDQPKDTGSDTANEKSSDVGNGVLATQPEDQPDKEIEYIHGLKLASVMLALTLATFLMLLDVSILVTAIPRITTQFHSLTDVGWYGAAYNLASAALQPVAGKLYTHLPVKWTFLGFFFIFEVGSLICATAVSSPMFIIGRAVAGIGGSGIQNGALTIIAACSPLEDRAKLIGALMGFCQVGLVAGPLIGGALTQYSTWRWCFYLNLPIGAITAIIMLIVTLPDYRAQQKVHPGPLTLKKLDLPGFFIFAPFAIMILLALEFGGNKYPWKSATEIGLFCGGGVALVLFILWERHVGEGAMIPLSILMKRQVWASCLSGICLFSSILGISYYLSIYFQSVKSLTPFKAGVSMLPGIVSQLVFAVAGGGLIAKVGYYLPFLVACAVILTVGNGLLSTLTVHSSTVIWAAYQVIGGVGRGLGMQVPFLAIQANTDPAQANVATAALIFCQTFGGAVFLAIYNAIFNNALKHELQNRVPFPSADDIIHAGASGVKLVVPPQNLPGALASYAKAFDTVFYLVTALSGCMVFIAFGTGWIDLRKKKNKKPVVAEA